MLDSKVSVGWQTIFVLIPIVNLWAAYRIEKLRKYLLIFIPLGIGVSLVGSFFIPFPYSIPINYAIIFAIQIHFIRKWSIQWNEKLASNTTLHR